MAERRMFAKTIIDSDAFIEMPISARLLYYDLAMRADDDGFVNSPKKIMKFVGATNDDMNILIARKFILAFDDGVVVIKHWRIHNYIQNDRYKETTYKDHKKELILDENKAYKKLELGECIQDGYNMDTQVRLGKDSIGKSSSNKTMYEIYENEIGTLSPRQYEKLNYYLNDIPEELIIEAIYKTADSGKKSFNYMSAILNDWKSKGYKTLGDIKNESKNKKTKEDEIIERFLNEEE